MEGRRAEEEEGGLLVSACVHIITSFVSSVLFSLSIPFPFPLRPVHNFFFTFVDSVIRTTNVRRAHPIYIQYNPYIHTIRNLREVEFIIVNV